MLGVFRGIYIPMFGKFLCSYSSNRFLSFRKSKVLFRIGSFELSLFSVLPRGVFEYSKKGLNLLSSYVDVKIDVYSDLNQMEESKRYKDIKKNKKLWKAARKVGKLAMMSCYSKQDGTYVGSPEDVWFLLNKGITQFYKRTPHSAVCSVGFDGKHWWGWSHRAIEKFWSRADADEFAESVS